MSRKNLTVDERIAEMEAHERRNREREAEEAEARLDGPVSRRELLDAIDRVRANFAGNGFETSDMIARAFEQLAAEIA